MINRSTITLLISTKSNNSFMLFLTEIDSKRIYEMIVTVNIATMDTFSCLRILFHALKICKKRAYGNGREVLP